MATARGVAGRMAHRIRVWRRPPQKRRRSGGAPCGKSVQKPAAGRRTAQATEECVRVCRPTRSLRRCSEWRIRAIDPNPMTHATSSPERRVTRVRVGRCRPAGRHRGELRIAEARVKGARPRRVSTKDTIDPRSGAGAARIAGGGRCRSFGVDALFPTMAPTPEGERGLRRGRAPS